ncbi:MAG: S-layer homology domain-containing protein [Peptococcaceae bacterium]|nr:S-layer homology domain-containing protein [Peptococcaceae bacterium]
MRTPRKLTALILMGALAVSSVAVVPAQAKTFNDVSSNHWAYKVVDEVSNRGIMIGTGSGIFSPNTQLTRAEYCAVLYNIAPNKSSGTFTTDYTDVKDTDWFAGAAKWAVSNGIISMNNKKFEPQTPISREEMANTTYSFLAKNYYKSIDHNWNSAGYADQDKITTGYSGAINVLTNNGLLSGRGNNMFEPQGTLTRAEAAAMASRVLGVIDKYNDSSNQPAEEPEVTPDTPSEEPEVTPDTPTDTPSNPPVSDIPAEDPNDPANWDLDGAPEWFKVGNPGSFSDEQWNDLITYWQDKGKPADYPSKIPSIITTEEQAKAYFEYYLNRLYDYMQEDDAITQLEAGTVSLSSEEMKMVEMVNNARLAAGVPVLKVSPKLCEAAKIRAKEALYAEAHRRPNGDDCTTVLKDVGLYYQSLETGMTNVVYYNENQTVWKNHASYSAEYAFEQFFESPGHKRAMLDSTYQYIGIGYYSDGNNSAWVQSFARI